MHIIFRQAKSKRPPVKSSISVPVGEFSRSISMSPEHHNNLANNPPSPATTSGASAAKCKNLAIYDSYIESLLSFAIKKCFDSSKNVDRKAHSFHDFLVRCPLTCNPDYSHPKWLLFAYTTLKSKFWPFWGDFLSSLGGNFLMKKF